MIGAYYKAPGVDEIDKFEEVLSELMPLYSDVIILGDLNENLLFHDVHGNCCNCELGSCGTCRLKRCLNQFGLTSMGSSATNFDQTPSQLDLILTNQPAKFSVFNQVSSGLSNHDIVFGTFVCSGYLTNENLQFWRNYNSINIPRLASDLENSSLNDIYSQTDINSMLDQA